jgi:prepilin-type N-terminal cleavage/methylation domain-containing protein
MQFSFSKKSGFTLIEIIMAILVMTIGIVGIYAILPRIISVTATHIDRFIASQLAKEGIEIVRNIRDTNWLEGESFDNGLSDGDWRVQYNKDYLLPFLDEPLRIDQGFYNYDQGELTKFKRKVTLSHPQPDILNVKVQISWPGKGSPFEVEENLHDWR